MCQIHITPEHLKEINKRCKGVFPSESLSYRQWCRCILASEKDVMEGYYVGGNSSLACVPYAGNADTYREKNVKDACKLIDSVRNKFGLSDEETDAILEQIQNAIERYISIHFTERDLMMFFKMFLNK